jgi:hypothetical protein
MTGLELYIRDDNFFYCYKQNHDGDRLNKFLDKKSYHIFKMSPEQIINEFHNNYFFIESEINYKDDLKYGIKIPNDLIKFDDFYEVYLEINKYIQKNYSDYDEDCGDYVYIDLVNQRMEYSDKNENSDSTGNNIKDEDCGCI